MQSLSDGEWTLKELIKVAVDIGILPSDRENSVDQNLRDFRNYVHPKKELREQYPCEQAEAQMAQGALNSLCNIFEKNITV